MELIEIPQVVVKTAPKCSCGEGYFEQILSQGNPVMIGNMYQHKCTACNKTKTFNEVYPKLVYQDLVIDLKEEVVVETIVPESEDND